MGWAEAANNNSNGDDFPDYNRLEYAKPLPPVAEQVPEAKPGSIDLKVGMQQPTESEPLDAIPVRIGRSSQDPDDGEPSMAGMLDDSQVSTSTALAHPVVSTTSAVSK